MKRKPKFEIERPAPGITYREGYKQHQFPIFEQDGETVFVECPTRSAFTFSSLRVVGRGFPKSSRKRTASARRPVWWSRLSAETKELAKGRKTHLAA